MKTVFLLASLFAATIGFSQNITFDQAQALRTKSLAVVEETLTAKGWTMTEAEEETEERMASASFGYNVSQFDSEKATAWIRFHPSSLGTAYNRISIQIHKPALYTTFSSRLAANGYKLKSSNIIDGGIRKVYQNATTTCIVTTATSEGTYTKSTTYTFFFLNNISYKLNYETEEEG